MHRIFIVEDDAAIAAALQKHLTTWGFDVRCAEDFRNVLAECTAFDPQLVLLDITLPFYNGYHWCQELRRVSNVPVVFISSASDNMNIVMAMNMGGDDFIAKPFDLNVLLAKIYLSALFPEVPPWVWVVGFVTILTLANLKSVNLVANFNTLFVLVQIAIMVVFVILVVHGLHKGEGVGTVWSLQPFISENAHLIPIITGATIVCFSFLGFDAVTTLSEETPNAARVIPKAIFLTALYGGLIFIVASFFMQLFFPTIARFKNPDAALPEIALYVGGKLFQSVFLCTTFVNTLASGLASHASVSRLLYVMGRDNVFPERVFGYVHPKWRTPALNVIMVGIVALSALYFDLVTATALINFGALVAFTFVNLSVYNHFWRRKGLNKTWKDRFHYLLLPLIGAVTVGVLWINLEATSLTLGLIWAALGILYLTWLTRRFRKPPPQFEAGKIEQAWDS